MKNIKRVPRSKAAFSLLELMLVVVIIGIVYALVLSSFKAPKKQGLDSFTLLTLPKYLRQNYKLSDAKIVCFEPCGKCNVMLDGSWLEDEVELFSSAEVSSYELGLDGYASEKEFAPQDMNDAYKKACFVLHKRPNGSIESVVLKNENKFLYYKAGYEEVKSFDSLAELQNDYQKIANEIGVER